MPSHKLKSAPKTFEDVLFAWATHIPADMQDEMLHDKMLDSFLRLFDNLSSAQIKIFPPRTTLLNSMRRAIHWQWIALNIPMHPLLSAAAPHALTLAALRWLRIWKMDKTPGRAQLMAAIDRDLSRIDAAVQYITKV